MRFEDIHFSQASNLQTPPVEQQSFKITFVKDTSKTPPVLLEDLPKNARKALDELAALVLDTEERQTILHGFDQTGKTFLLDQLVYNSHHYTQRMNSGPLHFISLTDIDMIELENTHNLKKIAVKLREAFNINDENICFVTTTPEIALYVANVLPLCRVVLKLDTPELGNPFQAPSASLTRVWQSWQKFDTNSSFLCSRDELVSLLWVTMAERLNNLYPFQLTRAQVATFVDYFLKRLGEAEEERNGQEVVIVPPGVWATCLKQLVSTIVFTSDESLLTPKGAVSFSKAMKVTFQQTSALFGDLDPQERDEDGLFGNAIPQDIITLMEATGVGQAVMVAGSPQVQQEVDNTPLVFKNTSTLAQRLKTTIMGQDDTVERVADSLMVPAAGLNDPNKPVRSFLFLGPTGVGKTQLALDLAKEVAEEELPVVRIDMSEYQEAHEVSKLFGAPPGYTGHDQGGVLTNAVAANPKCVLLLDEIEKANPRVWDAFLQVLDAGRMTDSIGRVVDFTQVIIILTSNIGAHEAARRKTGFSITGALSSEDAAKNNHSIVMRELERIARPEFINRIDDVMVFNPLTEESAHKIVDRELAVVKDRLKTKGYKLQVEDPAVADLLLEKADISRYGAREIQRIVFRNVSAPVAKFIVKHAKKKNLTLTSDSSSIVIN